MSKNKQKKYLKVIETIVFSLLIILVVFANSYGPIYIRIIPLLFILGIIGNLFFEKAIITTIFGIITAMCILHIKEKYGFFENIFLSFSFGLNIVLGECAGKLIKKTYILMDKKNKKFKNKKIFIYVTTIVFLFVACPLIHGLINGNLLRYTKTKNKLIEYLQVEYGENEKNFYISDAEYNLGKNSSYIFKVKYEEKVYNFVVYVNDNLDIIDGYKQYNLEKTNKKITNEFNLFIDTINCDNFEVKLEEKTKNIFITYNFKNDFEESIKKLVNDLNLFESFPYIDDINKIDISIKNLQTLEIEFNATIDSYKYFSLDSLDEKETYLKNAFLVEYIDKDI